MKAVLITSSILILLIAALRPVLRGKIPPKAQYALWLIVALRLLIPVNLVTSAYSALALLERADEPPQIVQAIGQTAIPVQSYDDARAQVVQEYVRQGVPETSFTPADLTAIDRQAQELMRGPTVGEIAARLAKPLWLTGAALMAGWFLLVNAKLRRRLRNAKRLGGVDCPLPVYVSDALPSPCLCGTLRPAIYVTPAALNDPDRLRHVLAHELTHYRHRDHWWAVLRCVCLCAYWFDPLVWWAAALSRQDCELACDEGAIRRLGEGERIPYGRTLVAMIAAGRNPLLQTATTMTGGKRRVRERVRLIARRPKTVVAVALALTVIIACAVGCTFTGAPEGSDEPDPSPSLEPDEPRPTLDTLVERLMTVPEEWRDKVDVSADNIEPEALATYWLNDPKWADLWSGYLMTLYRMDEARIRENLEQQLWPAADIFARSGDEYYAIIWPDDGRYQYDDDLGEEYWSAVNTMKDYVKKTVLETEGVEPFNPNRQPLDTLVERLDNIPEELRGDAVNRRVEMGLTMGQSNILAAYHFNVSDPSWEGLLGWVYQWDQADFEDWLYTLETGAFEVFARDSEHYYALFRPTSVQYGEEDAERFAAAQKAIGEFARQQVLDTEGVEAFNADELREREYLWEGKTYTDVAYWPYKAVTGETDVVWIFRLVQPASQGPGGVWIVERVEYYDRLGKPASIEHTKPDTGGLTVLEYGQQLQAQADAGQADWATDPIEMLRRYVMELHGDAYGGVAVPADSFTDIAVDSFRANSGPSEEQQAIQAVMDAIIAADETSLTLAPGGTSRVYTYPIPSLDEWDATQGYWTYRLSSFATDFRWEKLDALPEGMNSTNLIIQPSGEMDCIWLWDAFNMVAIRTPDNQIKYYQAVSNSYGDPVGTSLWNPSPYEYLRQWFDEVELSRLRTTSVPDRGQSHEDVVAEWIEGFEGAMAKCAPGSMYACTYTRAENVQADAHSFMSKEDMDDFAQSRGYSGDEYGKTWFTFSYELVFVPENENAREYLQAGNTADYADYYPADGAPEGAQFFMRVAYMTLIDGNWVCEGTGTGW